LPLENRIALAKAFKILYRSGYSLDEALSRIADEVEPLPEVLEFLAFCRESKRGLLGFVGVKESEEKDETEVLIEK
jgi:UDP-N-acetylglucosamine acyltransferase